MSETTIYTEEIADRILLHVSEGRSLTKLCSEEGMPNKATIFRWLDKNVEFRGRYLLAKDFMVQSMAEDLLEIADDSRNDTLTLPNGAEIPNREWIDRSRLRVDARKWLMAKLMPKKWGDRQQVEHSGEVRQLGTLTLADLDRRIEEAQTAVR